MWGTSNTAYKVHSDLLKRAYAMARTQKKNFKILNTLKSGNEIETQQGKGKEKGCVKQTKSCVPLPENQGEFFLNAKLSNYSPTALSPQPVSIRHLLPVFT